MIRTQSSRPAVRSIKALGEACLSTQRHRRYNSSSVRVAPPAPYDILFCGTDAFASRSLAALLTQRTHLCSSLHVLTPPDVQQTWGANRMKVSPVKQLALQNRLPHTDVPPNGMVGYAPPSHLSGNDRAIMLTCSFGHLIPDALLDAFPNPWQRINIHPSLLPELRGAAPIQWALARRMSRSGVSIQTLERGKFDTGRIVAQEPFDFPPSDGGFLQVERVMAERAAELLIRTLLDLPHFWQNSWDQDERYKTYAPKLKAQHSVVKWHQWTAQDVVARERGVAYMHPLSTTLQPPPSSSSSGSFRPVAITLSDTSTMTFEELRLLDPALATALKQTSIPAGSAIYSAEANKLIAKTVSPTEVLSVDSVKVAGKKVKTAHEWWRAYRDRVDPTSGLVRFQ